MTDIYELDPEMELEVQVISNYEQELKEFTNKYVNDKDFRMEICRKYNLSIIYEPYEEVWSVYEWEEILTMFRNYWKAVSFLHNRVHLITATRYAEENETPF